MAGDDVSSLNKGSCNNNSKLRIFFTVLALFAEMPALTPRFFGRLIWMLRRTQGPIPSSHTRIITMPTWVVVKNYPFAWANVSVAGLQNSFVSYGRILEVTISMRIPGHRYWMRNPSLRILRFRSRDHFHPRPPVWFPFGGRKSRDRAVSCVFF